VRTVHTLRPCGRPAIDFATSRAQAMKSWATGLSVRFFRVRIPTGLPPVGMLMGKALISGFPAENLNTEAGTIVRKRPLASRALRAGMEEVTSAARGRSSPLARKASTTIAPSDCPVAAASKARPSSRQA